MGFLISGCFLVEVYDDQEDMKTLCVCFRLPSWHNLIGLLDNGQELNQDFPILALGTCISFAPLYGRHAYTSPL